MTQNPPGSLNARLSSAADGRLYNPNRDVAHCFKFVVEQVSMRFDTEQWRALTDLLDNDDVSLTDVGNALQCFIKFVASSVDNGKETMESCLQRTGFLDCSDTEQIAVLSYVGLVVTGMFFQGVREVTLGGRGPVTDTSDLRLAGELAANAITRKPGAAVNCPLLAAIENRSTVLGRQADSRFVGRTGNVLIFQDNDDKQYYQVTVSHCERPGVLNSGN